MTPQEFLQGKEYIIDVCFIEPTPIVQKLGLFNPSTGEKFFPTLVPSLTIRAPFGTLTTYIERGKPIVDRVYFDDGRVLQSMTLSPYGVPGKTEDDVAKSRQEGFEWIQAIETMTAG